MPHGAEHAGALVVIVHIRANGLCHGDAVTGAAGVREHMHAVGGLRAVIIEHRLEPIHQLPISGIGAGGDDAGLAGDFHSPTLILCLCADDLTCFVGF